MMKGIHKCSSAAHRKTGNRSEALVFLNPVFFLNKRHQLLEEEIFIQPVSFHIIEVATCSSICIRHNNYHWGGRAVINGFIGYIQNLTKLNPSGLIITRPM